MGSSRYLCIDCGLTTVKAAVFDDGGVQLSGASADTPLRTRGETSEIDMEEAWSLVAGLAREAISRGGAAAQGIAAVGVSGHGGGIYSADAGGKPVRAAITSMDRRAEGIVERWSKEGRSRYELTRHHPWSGQSLPLLCWIKAEEPAAYRNIRWAFGAKDWITFKLSGTASTDRTEASNNALLDLGSGSYAPSVLGTFGAPEAEGMLPSVRESASIVGAVTAKAAAETGIPAGIPVIAGMFDVMACAVGSGALTNESYSLIAGTWNINSAFSSRLLESAPTTKASLGPDPGRFAYVESSATSAGNLAWLVARIEELCPGTDRKALYERIDEGVSKVPAGAEGLVYLPFIHRSHIAPGADGAFVGMRASHGAFHMLRAAFEGVAFAHRAHLEILARAGLDRKRVLLSGGAAASGAWCGIFASALGRRVETSDASQAGARGIAAAAAVATGRYSSLEEASAAMSRVKETYEPDAAETVALNEAYSRFREIAAALGKIAGS
jgi:L-xylulokinase